MKQKALFMILLAGFLNLISCISDNESQSVTDLRNARVDEARAQAELLRAQAALDAAQAALFNAQAAYQQALTAAQELQNTIGEASAKQQIAMILAQIEIDALNNQVALITAQQALETALAGQTTAKATLINTIMTSYVDYSVQLNNARQMLMMTQVELEKLDKGIYDPNEAAYRELNNISKLLANLIKEYDALKQYRSVEREQLKAEQMEVWEALNEASLLHSEALQASMDASTKVTDQAMLIMNNTVYNMLLTDLTFMHSTEFNNFLNTYITYTEVTEGSTTYGGTLMQRYHPYSFSTEYYFETPPAAGTTTPGSVFLYNDSDTQYTIYTYDTAFYYPDPVDGVYPDGFIAINPTYWYSRDFNVAGFTAIYDAAKAALAGDATALAALETAWNAIVVYFPGIEDAKAGYDKQVAIFNQLVAESVIATKYEWDTNDVFTTLLAEYNAIAAILNMAYTGYAADGTAWTMTIEERLAALETEIDTQKQAIDTQWVLILDNDYNATFSRQLLEDDLALYQTQVNVLEKIVAALKAQLDAALADMLASI